MADGTSIEWTDATWTPVKGCTRVSPGCGGPGLAGGCYAEIMAARFSSPGQWGEGLAKIVTLPDGTKDHRWTGEVRFDEAELLKPLSLKRPRKIFVCSTADLFHEKVTDEQIDKVFAIMALCPQHTFQVLTKRPARMREYMASIDNGDGTRLDGFRSALVEGMAQQIWHGRTGDDSVDEWLAVHLPLPNVWLGVSAEDQPRWDERVSILREVPAAIRWVSAEPLLDYIDGGELLKMIDWVVVGGESGPGARLMFRPHVRSLRDQCAAAGVPFLMKQWGEWIPAGQVRLHKTPIREFAYDYDDRCRYHRVGKKAAGRLLDGVLHDAYPAGARG